MSEGPEPSEKMDDAHTHPMGWFQIFLYIALVSAFSLGVGFIIRGL
ncbi:MAG: hypothetical protein AAGB06_01385 [Verrucomicrobiota bacterium]